MEELPVEVVGKILSHIAAARDVVLASGTCRKWRQAFREHLRALSFKSVDWPGSRFVSTTEIENVITRTIFQTTGLQSLVIEIEDYGEFSTSSVTSWLLYTRNNLRELECNMKTGKALNVVDIFGRGKLEKLTLANDEIKNVDSIFHRVTSLRSLSLSDVRISELDFSALLDACPELESLELIYEDNDLSCHLSKPVKALNLRRFYLDGISSNNLILEMDSIEHLHLGHCDLNSFKLIGKGTLKEITMDNVTVSHLELCDSTQNLETVDIYKKMIPKSEFYSLLSKSPELRVLGLWNLSFHQWAEALDLGMIAMSCPHLTLLYLPRDLEGHGEMLPYCLQGSTRFENLGFLDIGWSNTLKDKFLDFFMVFLEHCPRLKWLVIRISHGDAWLLSYFIGCIIRITRKYVDLDVRVKFHDVDG